jgi:hypothetical protein
MDYEELYNEHVAYCGLIEVVDNFLDDCEDDKEISEFFTLARDYGLEYACNVCGLS